MPLKARPAPPPSACCSPTRSRSAGCCWRRAATARRVLPEIVQIESTNICNAKCVFCPRDDMERKQGVMDMALFRKVVDECAALGITHVRMHNYGEAFVDRQLVEKVALRQADRHHGGRAHQQRVADLRRGGPRDDRGRPRRHQHQPGRRRQGGVRADARRPEVRQGHRQRSSASSAIRQELGRTRPKLILSFVRQDNSDEEQAFIEHWGAKADKIHITDLHNWAGTLDGRADVNFPCYRQWLTFTVLWDGRVSLCCADFDGREILGDLRTSTDQGRLERRRVPSPCAARTSSTAAPPSASRATCRRRTRRCG